MPSRPSPEKIALRNKILGTKSYLGGTARFDRLSLADLGELIKQRLASPSEQKSQNQSPTTKQFYEFMKRWPMATAHGFAVSPLRQDCGVVIEGLEVSPLPKKHREQLVAEFAILNSRAEELVVTPSRLFSWFD